MDIVHHDIERYLWNSIPERDAVLTEMEQVAEEKNFPIVGPLVGRLFYLLTVGTKAKRVLELGSGFGYSAYWFAKGVGKDGKVILTEKDDGNVRMAEQYLRRGGLLDRVEILQGDALKLIEKISGSFDVIFNDINKRDYPKGFRKAIPLLRKGGLFIADNVLWHGKILAGKPDTETAGILTFNRLIFSKEVFTTILPLRDGVSISLKL
ncbi:MAG: O-methyltransferase [Bacteroidota bacterium]